MSALLQVAKQLGVNPKLLRYGSRTPGAIPDVILMKVSDRPLSTSAKPAISSQSSRPSLSSNGQHRVGTKSTERSASQASQFEPASFLSHDHSHVDLFTKSSAPTDTIGSNHKSKTMGTEDFPYKQVNKNQIPEIFAMYLPGVDPLPYQAAAEVFPTRINNYVLENHINWANGVEDPYFKLVIPSPGMLSLPMLEEVMALLLLKSSAATKNEKAIASQRLRDAVQKYQQAYLNAHPAGQVENKPKLDGCEVQGLQHKYRETALWFPSEAQTCHAWCTYCFRWQQFTDVGGPSKQFKSASWLNLLDYISKHKQITDLLFTGGDPMVMTAKTFRNYLGPLLHNPHTAHLDTIRIGTKSLAYWPRKFTTDKDAKATLQMFRDVVNSGKNLSIQAHFTHPRELDTPEVQEAIKAIKETGAVIRCQSPIVRGINDSADIWTEMWKKEVKLGMIPYYMFVERDTGAKEFFELPLAKVFKIYNETRSRVSGLARGAQGPSMSAKPGKVQILDIVEHKDGRKSFLCTFIQARHPAWVGRTFHAEYSETATWLDGDNGLKPFDADKFFWEDEYAALVKSQEGSSGQWNVTNDRWNKLEKKKAEN
ncbi:hypothetical protein HYFRA_00010811 [Hymenoscyphus fraxineus]|uniref:L-lysine 2,3-aminomutase n=1 Tax=Hymenoscyphus fraxineus TaxID=746836 RepID=A0A9N9KZL9_9HELO|nr:hypothetical protein HYFRA_00010811 [Hymenoscyphus fraxineus]